MRRRKMAKMVEIALSALYLIVFIVAFVKSRLSSNTFDFFGFDGITLIGAVLALANLLISNMGGISNVVNQILTKNKMVNYQIAISLEDTEWPLLKIVDFFEDSIKRYYEMDSLERKPVSSIQSSRVYLIYKDIGISLDFQEQDDRNSERKDYSLRIAGHGKYGRITSSKKDIVYFGSIIRMLANQCLMDQSFINCVRIGYVEIIINRTGSQFAMNNIFSDDMPNVSEYWVKAYENSYGTELEITQEQIKWRILDAKDLLDGAEKLTNLLCKTS